MILGPVSIWRRLIQALQKEMNYIPNTPPDLEGFFFLTAAAYLGENGLERNM